MIGQNETLIYVGRLPLLLRHLLESIAQYPDMGTTRMSVKVLSCRTFFFPQAHESGDITFNGSARLLRICQAIFASFCPLVSQSSMSRAIKTDGSAPLFRWTTGLLQSKLEGRAIRSAPPLYRAASGLLRPEETGLSPPSRYRIHLPHVQHPRISMAGASLVQLRISFQQNEVPKEQKGGIGG